MMRTRQPGRPSSERLPEDIDWKVFPAFPPSARLAAAEGPDYPAWVIGVAGDSTGMSTATARSPATPTSRRRAGEATR